MSYPTAVAEHLHTLPFTSSRAYGCGALPQKQSALVRCFIRHSMVDSHSWLCVVGHQLKPVAWLLEHLTWAAAWQASSMQRRLPGLLMLGHVAAHVKRLNSTPTASFGVSQQTTTPFPPPPHHSCSTSLAAFPCGFLSSYLPSECCK